MERQDYEWQVERIIEASAPIKRNGLNRSMLALCVAHMHVESEEEALSIAERLPYTLRESAHARGNYGVGIKVLESDPESVTQDIMRYWRYCRRLGFL